MAMAYMQLRWVHVAPVRALACWVHVARASTCTPFCRPLSCRSVKDELEEAVFLPLQHPHLFRGPIRSPPRTFLLHGPPGTGKTLLVEKVAAEAGFMLLSLSPSLILSKWAGDSEKTVRSVFELAKSFQPCIIFLVRSTAWRSGHHDAAASRRDRLCSIPAGAPQGLLHRCCRWPH